MSELSSADDKGVVNAPDSIKPDWLIDEVASAGRENLDAEHVSLYDIKEDASSVAEVQYLGKFGLSQESVVVDMGSGTGQFTLAVAPLCARVVAVDVSPVMMRQLKANVARAQLTNVDIVRAGFLSYEYKQGMADIVYSRYALHHLPDFWKTLALKRMYDNLRPGGILRLWDVVYSFEPSEAEERLEAWCSTLDDTSGTDAWQRSDIVEHVRDEHSTFSWLLEAMAQKVGFSNEETEYSDDTIFAKYIFRRPPDNE